MSRKGDVAGCHVRRTGTQNNVSDLFRIEGNLPTILRSARDLIAAQIKRSVKLHDLFFREMPEYPPYAWQEALVNAVAHRDYAIRGRGIEVWLYDDRMELISPGGLVGDVTLDAIRKREAIHESRNPFIARVLVELGIMREQGEGIPRIFDEMEASWLPPPAFDANEREFKVTLFDTPIYDVGDPQWARAVRALPLIERQKRALVVWRHGAFANSDYQSLNRVDRDTAFQELIQQGVRMTNTDYRGLFGVDRETAKRELRALVDDGKLRLVGSRRGAHYVAGPRWSRG